MNDKWSIDLETRSLADLTVVGGWHYARHPSTEILCAAVRRNSEPVLVWSPIEGFGDPGAEQLLREMLADDGPIYAHNATGFEVPMTEHVLTRMGFPAIGRTRWRCTATMARRANIPPSLEKAAEALRLANQKDKGGSALIKLFSIPRKDGGFNDPSEYPEQFRQFLEYCRQDVMTECDIAEALKHFELKGWLLDIFHEDININGRGMPVNLDALHKAQALIEAEKGPAFEEFRQLTGLNPTQNAALRAWFASNGLLLDNLQADTLEALQADPATATGRAIELLQKLGFAAVKKVDTMIECAGPDDNFIRGSLQFYGAQSTARWCLTGDHEVLTPDGWVRLDAWQGGRIAVWNKDVVSFQKSLPVSFPYEGEMLHHESARMNQIATPDHKMGGWNRDRGIFEVKTVDRLNGSFGIPYSGRLERSFSFSNDELRLLVATQADGCYTPDGGLRFNFKKLRKVDRLKALLRRQGIVYTINGTRSVTFTISCRNVPLYLRMFKDKVFGSWLLDVDPSVFFDELEHWDAYRCGPKSLQYSTCVKENAEWVQALAHVSGMTANILVREGRKENWNICYTVNIWLEPKGYHYFTNEVKKIQFSGTVYCASTPTGFFLVRREGRVWVTGNSGRLHQPQNFKRPEFEETEQAYAHIRAGWAKGMLETWYDRSVYSIIASCIRHFIHDAQGPMLSADYSAIEARVTAWLAGEEWRLEVFRTHGKIYESSACQMFGLTMDQVTKPIRQKSKVAELALQYQGGVGALEKMGALDMGLTKEELPGLVKAWRAANPAITAFWRSCDNAAKQAIEQPGMWFDARLIKIGVFAAAGAPYLFIRLPSGRCLCYRDPRMEWVRIPKPKDETPEQETERMAQVSDDGRKGYRFQITHFGPGSTAGGARSAVWGRATLYGGKIVENITQAVAFDLMANGTLVAARKGYRIYSLIHDEAMAAWDNVETQSIEDFQRCLESAPAWADGLPLGTSGEVVPYYRK